MTLRTDSPADASSGAAYGFYCKLQGPSFADVVARVTDALKTEGFGLLLPCNVIVREEAAGSVMVGFMDPVAVMRLTDDPEVAKVADEVRGRLERVRSALVATPGSTVIG